MIKLEMVRGKGLTGNGITGDWRTSGTAQRQRGIIVTVKGGIAFRCEPYLKRFKRGNK